MLVETQIIKIRITLIQKVNFPCCVEQTLPFYISNSSATTTHFKISKISLNTINLLLLLLLPIENSRFDESLMWPIRLLYDKFLKDEQVEFDGAASELPTMSKSQNLILPREHFVQVPHIRQLSSWDCGLACVLMVLRTLGVECDFSVLLELCDTTSIWTVDLAYLLQKYSVSFSFFTVTLGVNPDFSVEMFYKEQLPDDLVRVDELFQKALQAGINIQCRSVSGEQLSVLLLSGNYIAIALVDQYKLSPSWMEGVSVSGLYSGNAGYTGHFVVICGYDADNCEFDIRDPASSRKNERVTLNCLQDARKSFGTDEDLLLISLK